MLRRLISILLLAILGLPLAAPMLAMGQDGDTGSPACCRRNGKHHCMMSMDERGRLVLSDELQFKAAAERCPYSPASVAPTPPNSIAVPAVATAIYGDLVSHPAGLAQPEAKRQSSRDQSHWKRGPPTLTVL